MLHDYHLYTAPALIRAARPEAVLHHFVHIPWSQPDSWRVLPGWIRERIYDGLLANDIIGFHTRAYCINFLSCCEHLMGYEVDYEDLTVSHPGGKTAIRSYPLSIDAAGLERAADSPEVAEAEAFVREVGFPIVAKPPAGLGARATWRVNSVEELHYALARFDLAPHRPVQCEEFVTGRENTCETVMLRGEVVWHSGTHYLNAPLEVLENPWMQYCVVLPREEQPEHQAFQPVNDAALRALGLESGLSHLEWFLR
jgi:hypothetical protein